MTETMHKERLIFTFQKVKCHTDVGQLLDQVEWMGVEGIEELVDEEGAEVLQQEDGSPADLGAEIFQGQLGALGETESLQRALITVQKNYKRYYNDLIMASYLGQTLFFACWPSA